MHGASNLQPFLHHAGVVSAQNWSTGERLCGGDANALTEELEPLFQFQGSITFPLSSAPAGTSVSLR